MLLSAFLNVARYMRPHLRKIKAAFHRKLDDLQLNLDVIDVLTATGAWLLGLKTH